MAETIGGQAAIAVGLAIYARMVRLAHDSHQVVGEKRDHYVTLEQLEWAFVSIRDELRAAPPTCFNCEAAEGLRVVPLCADCFEELNSAR